MTEKRVLRLEEEIKRIISNMIIKELKDPRIDKFASITSVDLSKDYSVAKIYVSALDDEKRAATVKGLKSASGFIKRELSKNLTTRIMPELIFLEDDSIEKSFELFAKIDELKEDQ